MLSQPSPRALPGRPGGAVGTPGAHCACAGVPVSRARAFPLSASLGGKASPCAHASIPDRHPPPTLWARESSHAAVRTGGGVGKPAQTRAGFAEEVAGEGERVGSSGGSRSGPRRRLGNPARGPPGGVRRPQGSRAALRLRGARRRWPVFPLARPGELTGEGSQRRGDGGCPGRRLARREGLWRRGEWWRDEEEG